MTVTELKEIIRTYEIAIVNMENNNVSDRIIDKTRLKLSALMKKLTLMKRKQEASASKPAETVINMPGSEPFTLYSDPCGEEEEIKRGDEIDWERKKFDKIIDKISVLFYKTSDKSMRSEFYEKTALLKEMFGDEPHTRDKFKAYINNLLTQ